MNRKKGFSLVEMVLALSIIFALMVAAFMIYKNISDRMQVKEFVDDINEFKQVMSEMSLNHTILPAGDDISSKGGYTSKSYYDFVKFNLTPKFANKMVSESGNDMRFFFSDVMLTYETFVDKEIAFGGKSYYGFEFRPLGSEPKDYSDACRKYIPSVFSQAGILGISMNGKFYKRGESSVSQISDNCSGMQQIKIALYR